MSEQAPITHVPSQQELESIPSAIILRDEKEAVFDPIPIENTEGRYGDIQNPVVAEIHTGSAFDRFVVFEDTAKGEHEKQYFIMNATANKYGKTYTAKAVLGVINMQSPHFFLGREEMIKRGVNAPKGMSKSHSIISLGNDGRMTIMDLNSENGTEIFVGDKNVEVINGE